MRPSSPSFLFCDHRKLPARERLWQGPWRWVIYDVTTLPLAMSLAERGADYVETMAVREMSNALRDCVPRNDPPLGRRDRRGRHPRRRRGAGRRGRRTLGAGARTEHDRGRLLEPLQQADSTVACVTWNRASCASCARACTNAV